MPQVTVYIREDDLPKWKALEKKSEFLHKALNSSLQGTVERVQEIIGVPEVPACCRLKQPCKHWSFDGMSNSWVNSITGEVREAE